MRVLTDMDALPAFRSPAVTVGSFDGVHLGHRYLLDILRERAALAGGESIVVTFDEHPRRVLDADQELRVLTPLAEKTALLAEVGVDNLVVMPFDTEVARMSPEEFVRDFLVGRLGAREIVVGYNHRFGRGRAGDADLLSEMGTKYGFSIFRAPRFTGAGRGGTDCSSDERGGAAGEKISSTTIREAVSRGDIAAAERMLGRKLSRHTGSR